MSHDQPTIPSASDDAPVIPLRTRPTPTQARVVAIASGKGGVGKTNLAANFALALGRLGVRVLAVDADLGLANLDIVLGLAPPHTSVDLLRGDLDIEDVLVPSMHDVWLLPGCAGSVEASNLEELRRYELMTAIDTLDTRFDAVVIDTGSGLGPSTLGFCGAAEEVMLVVTAEPTGLSDGLGMVRALHERHDVRHVKVVTNLVGGPDEGEAAFSQLRGLCNRRLDVRLEYMGALPFDPHVGRAVMRGQPVSEAYPDSPYGHAVTRIADRFMASTQRDARPGTSQIFWRRLLRQREHGAG
jgi:flagellar biosynthesis protein FlhG